MTSLGDALVWYRVQRGLSQEQLAARIALSRQEIAQIEQGKRQPSPDVLRAIADGLDVQLGHLWRLPRGGAA